MENNISSIRSLILICKFDNIMDWMKLILAVFFPLCSHFLFSKEEAGHHYKYEHP